MSIEEKIFIEPLLREMGEYLVEKQTCLVEVVSKGHLDLVTEADYEVERRFTEAISEKYPDDGVLAEERGRIEAASQVDSRLWVIDPLDGTVNYAWGGPLFSISIGLIENGKPKAGWVYSPVLKELYSADDEYGAQLNGNPLSLRKCEVPGLISLSSGFLSEIQGVSPQGVLPWLELGKLRNLGTQALQLCWVASGRLALNVNWEAKIWDDFAGALILKQAGGHYHAHGSQWMNGGLREAILNPENALQSVAIHPSLGNKTETLLNQTVWSKNEARCH